MLLGKISEWHTIIRVRVHFFMKNGRFTCVLLGYFSVCYEYHIV